MRVYREYGSNLVPQCELCWIRENSEWEPDGVDENGNISTRLITVSVPLNLTPGAVCECITCGRVTIAGIYITLDDVDDDIFEEGNAADSTSSEASPDET
jgi:hypothetical protein